MTASATALLRKVTGLIIVLLLFMASCREAPQKETPDLEAGFLNPPYSARPHTWWHWMNGNVTAEGITKDLEEMQKAGIGGVQQFDVTTGIPEGPVRYLSKEWKKMVEHGVSEAGRLGLEYCIHNCAGWSTAGGPWITPELSMKKVVWTETHVQGPMDIARILRRPEANMDYYEDIAVLAFPTPPGGVTDMQKLNPELFISKRGQSAAILTDGNPETTVDFGEPSGEDPEFIMLDFGKPYKARTLTLTTLRTGWYGRGKGELQVSSDGIGFSSVRDFEFYAERPWSSASIALDVPASRFYRIVLTRSNTSGSLQVAEVALLPSPAIEHWQIKAGFLRGYSRDQRDYPELPDSLVIARDRILNLSDQMDRNGHLQWEVPPGRWTIMRFGTTTTGKGNHPAPEEGTGLECDKMDREAARIHFDAMLKKMSDELEASGKQFDATLIDSYEAGPQNWTSSFPEQFKQIRGYDCLELLPVITGKVVESFDFSEKFLWDWRNTIADLFEENFYGYFGELAHEHGLKLYIEPYSGQFRNMNAGSGADIPMGEFWVGRYGTGNIKQAASIAHTTGRKYVGAESFTASINSGAWKNHPGKLKAQGDAFFCAGLNRIIFHTFVHQPNTHVKPGMTMGPWGMRMGWTNTWWHAAPEWLGYLGRCQFMLQSGCFVADICYFTGEDAPNGFPDGIEQPPPGYDYDGVNRETLLNAQAENGKILLPSGMQYRLLVLPDSKHMTPELLEKISELARAGASVYGPPPVSSPSLSGRKEDEEEYRQLVQKIWGDCGGSRVKEHSYGEGKIFCGSGIENVLKKLGVEPDFEYSAIPEKAELHFIHRKAGGTDFYFVSNQQQDKPVLAECSFRVKDKYPELWDPEIGEIRPLPVYTVEEGRICLPLKLDPSGSAFVVFRKKVSGGRIASVSLNGTVMFPGIPGVPEVTASMPGFAPAGENGKEILCNFYRAGQYALGSSGNKTFEVAVDTMPDPISAGGPWKIEFQKDRGAPPSIETEELVSWTGHADPGVRYFSGTATYTQTVQVPAEWLEEGRTVFLDLGKVREIATVSVNGNEPVVLWKPPFRTEVTGLLRKGDNMLRIEITNLWPNRLIGDLQNGQEYEYEDYGNIKEIPGWFIGNQPKPGDGNVAFATWDHYDADSELFESGLLGPVRLVPAVRRKISF